ncbi:ZN862-like protein [Mya arenaria]|uniref:ZN862-like protein n=1 Tax=Mya arenaria TaxID=6604 RepID=A0ABY7EHB2_MYAAR|nr:ZN862-like protein [Mya arenaria]
MKRRVCQSQKNYRNNHAAASFLVSIAEVARKETVSKLPKSQFVSFTIDGSTDFTGDDMENIYIRTVSLGRITDSFLHIGCAKSASAWDIHDHIKKVFKELNKEESMQSKLVGFTADGASNMQGLTALLRAKWPHIVVTHCLAYRLELAFKDAVQMSSKIYKRAMTLLIGLYSLYRKSPKQIKALMETFSVLNFKTSIMPTRIGGTRWLPYSRVTLLTRYPDSLDGVKWCDIFRVIKGRDVDQALKLVELLLALPPTSVKNKVTFSAMKLIKNRRRGRLSEETLNRLILVHMETPSVKDFDPEPSIKEWLTKPRRLHSGIKRKAEELLAVSGIQSEPLTQDQMTQSEPEGPIKNSLAPPSEAAGAHTPAPRSSLRSLCSLPVRARNRGRNNASPFRCYA